jgi:NAD(P)-dependent dehydrogenase (short-subunit alcohol dehydrogenase family)
MTEAVRRTVELLPGGRQRILYRLAHAVPKVKQEVVVVTGATALARGICRQLSRLGAIPVMVDRTGQGDSTALEVYRGRAGCSEIWEAISQQFRVSLVIHTAALDMEDLGDPHKCFQQIVADGVDLARNLRSLGPVPRIMASHHAVYNVGGAPPAEATAFRERSDRYCYGENLYQLERQFQMFAATGADGWTILRTFPILIAANTHLQNLWGQKIWPRDSEKTLEGAVLLDDAVDAFIKTYLYICGRGLNFMADVASGFSVYLPAGGAGQLALTSPNASPEMSPANTVGRSGTAQILHWQADRQRMAHTLAQVAAASRNGRERL